MSDQLTSLPDWKLDDRGSLWKLELTPILTLSVWHEIGQRGVVNPTPWRTSLFGARLMNRFATADEAKAFLLRAASRHLAAATEVVNARKR